jgi:hypothetical protein
VTLTEEAFWELLKEQSPEGHSIAKRLLDTYRERDDIVLVPRGNSLVASLDIQGTGQQASTFFVNKSGWVNVWPRTIRGHLEKAGLRRSLVDAYEEEMREILRMSQERREFSQQLEKVDIEALISAVNDFIERVQSADVVEE